MNSPNLQTKKLRGQAAYLKVENECLEKLAMSVGFANPEWARDAVLEDLLKDEQGGQTPVFDSKESWEEALTRVAKGQLLKWAEAEISDARSKLVNE